MIEPMGSDLLARTVRTADILSQRSGQDVSRVEVSQANASVESRRATLIRAQAAVRAKVDVFMPEPAPLAALTQRVRKGFDPQGVLNPGRMWAGV